MPTPQKNQFSVLQNRQLANFDFDKKKTFESRDVDAIFKVSGMTWCGFFMLFLLHTL